METFHITLRIRPEMCRDFIAQAVISEDPLDFSARQDRRYASIELLAYRQIPEALYKKHRKNNPTNSYFSLKREDIERK